MGRAERFSMERVISVLHISTHPTRSSGEGTEVLSSLGKIRSLSYGGPREPSEVPHNEPATVHLPTQKVLYQTVKSGKTASHL